MPALGQEGGELLRVDMQVDLKEVDTALLTNGVTCRILCALVRRDLCGGKSSSLTNCVTSFLFMCPPRRDEKL